jgi:hypothetical protein
MWDFVLVSVLKPTAPNLRHDAVCKSVGSLRISSPKRKYLFSMFLAGHSRVIPERPDYGLPGQAQV